MAAGATKMSSNFNYFQNGKYGSLPQNPQKDMEVSQDMHIKMSKKIAQLTKVIYALNTKNDEHDAVLQGLKEQHEDQIQQIYAETKSKVDLYKRKVSDQGDFLQKIEVLQKVVDRHEQDRQQALDEFEQFKTTTAQQESALKTLHAQRILVLSQEVLQAKREFESRLSQIDSLREELLNEKETAIQALEAKHRKELEELSHMQQSEQSELSAAKEQLEQKYRSDIERLHMDIARLSSDKKQLTEDYEVKLNKAQAFYEKELEALKKAQSASHEEQLTLLQEQHEKLKKDFQFAENQHQKRVDELLRQMVLKEEESENLRQQLEQLQNHLQARDSSTSQLGKQLQDAHDEASRALTRLKEVEGELIASRERCNQQAQDLVNKSTIIGELDATKLQNEATIQDLRSQLEKAKDRISWLDGSRRALESEKETKTAEQIDQIKSLQESLEELSIEKQKLREQYEREIATLKETTVKERESMIHEHTTRLELMTNSHKQTLDDLRQEADRTLTQVKQEMETLLEDERTRNKAEQLAMKEEYEKNKTELMSKLARAEEEIQRLSKIVADSEQGLGSAASQVNGLRESVDRLKAELDQTRNDLRSSKSKYSALHSDHEKLKLTHESKMTEAQLELKTRLEQLAIDLDNKWKDTLRKECEKLRREITEQKDEDKRSALEHLTLLKDREFAAAKQGWENKLQQLLQEISGLRSKLDSHEQSTSSELDKVRRDAEAEIHRLNRELLESGQGYSKKIDDLENMYREQLQQLHDQKDQEQKELESRMRGGHLEEMQATMMAHKSQISSLKEQADKQKQEELDALRAKNGERLECLRTEMEHMHSIEMEQIGHDHQQQVYAARMELDRALEISKQKEGEHALKLSELEETIHHREASIRNLEEEIKRLKRGINDMAHDLEAKGKEILRIRSESNQAIRTREEELSSSHRDELETLTSEHLHETQDMLAEFSKAQQLLKDKIAELQMLLEEAEDRYRNREAREEDLAAIQQLEDACRERELAIQKLVDDKKFYQRELVNRETNFNKVFSASPNVGVLNPLLKKPKKNDAAPMKFSGSPALSGRLDPLPGSPIHDGNFNHMRPLPPPTKKFVR